jgi:hypothetical protein
MEMPHRGKRGKPNCGFPLFPPRLEIANRAIPTFPQARRLVVFLSKKNAINRPTGARWRRNCLPDLRRAGYNNCCSDCCSIGRFWGDRHWPDLE